MNVFYQAGFCNGIIAAVVIGEYQSFIAYNFIRCGAPKMMMASLSDDLFADTIVLWWFQFFFHHVVIHLLPQ